MATEKKISVNDIDLKLVKIIYFIGIGGIGMSALARYFNFTGKSVYGYDKTETELTKNLKAEGISIDFEDDIKLIPKELLDLDVSESLIVYTPAVPENHAALQFLTKNNYRIIKRSEALGIIVKNSTGLAVAGTHGKTTTSSILAHIIHESGEPVSAFLGGIATNFQSNFIHSEGAVLSVVEADEYDRSFLTLHPTGAIITSTDADHLDIYGEKHELLNSFKEFASQTTEFLIVQEDIANDLSFSGVATLKTYGWNSDSDYHITTRVLENGIYKLVIQTPYETLENVSFPMAGKHNSENALAALAMGIEAGLDSGKLVKALSSFKGIKRRFEIHINNDQQVYIDDYAHHPTELNAAISAAKELYPNKELTGIFQPHLYSRTKDFIEEFAESLSSLDQVILLDIYPARELPIAGVSSKWLLDKIQTKKTLLSKEEALQWVTKHNPSLLMTLGAGDIDQLITPIKLALS